MKPIKICLDEDVHHLIAHALRLRGWEAITMVDVGRQGLTDIDQIQFAVQGGYTIVSYNVADFPRLHYEMLAAGAHHCGIIVATQDDPAANARTLLAFVSAFSAEDVRDELIFLNNWM